MILVEGDGMQVHVIGRPEMPRKSCLEDGPPTLQARRAMMHSAIACFDSTRVKGQTL
jgi:hypothetical protein